MIRTVALLIIKITAIVGPVIDLFLTPLTLIAAIYLKLLRRFDCFLPITWHLYNIVGVLPVRHHFYEPLVLRQDLRYSLRQERNIQGLDLNIQGQLELLSKFHYQDELRQLPHSRPAERRYFYENGSFGSGDAEYYYSLIRHVKPKRITEIGSGYSTLLALEAIAKNKGEDPTYTCALTCIEPYCRPWLEALPIHLVRQRVECCDVAMFQALQQDDVLFIDSTHVIRPQGDVLFEYLEVLGQLHAGVLVHVHDVFTPYDYLDEWVLDAKLLWNEQYLLEAYLCYNKAFAVIGAQSYLRHNHWDQMAARFPVLAADRQRDCGSFWICRLPSSSGGKV